jgi:AraC-like DNA-binding protein
VRFLRIFKNKDYIKNDIISASQKKITKDCKHHGHEFFEIEYIIEGTGVYEIDGKEYRIAPNTLFFTTPTNIHAIKSPNASIINVMFTYDIGNDIIDVSNLLLNQHPCFHIDDETNDFFRVIFSEIVRVNATEAEYAMILLKCVLYRLTAGYGKENVMIQPSSCLRKAILFIHENFASDIGLDITAKHIGLTPSYFSDLFHKELGVTFKSYLDEIRFSYARKLLKYTSLSIKEIHFRAGFFDYTNFERRFKKLYGITPTSYRELENKK